MGMRHGNGCFDPRDVMTSHKLCGISVHRSLLGACFSEERYLPVDLVAPIRVGAPLLVVDFFLLISLFFPLVSLCLPPVAYILYQFW